MLAGLEIWRDDINEKGGLLGRPVELVYYDDQGSPANAPGIYGKLMGIDKVDLLIGPTAPTSSRAAMPAIIQRKRTTIGIFGLGANKAFHYPNYFSMNSQGPSRPTIRNACLISLPSRRRSRPRGLDRRGSGYSHNALVGARENAKALGFEVVIERTLSTLHDGLHADRARDAGCQSGCRVRGFVAGRYSQHHPGCARDSKFKPKLIGGA